MGYYIVTYRVLVDGAEKFCGDAIMVSKNRKADLNAFKSVVLKGYNITFPKASTIGITIIKTKEVNNEYFYEFYKSSKNN